MIHKGTACAPPLAPPVARTVACVDLFCGAGGLTHGFLQEGLPVVAGVDMDPACRFPYTTNNRALFVEQDIGTVTAADLQAWYGDARITVLTGCAPCQPFSSYAQRSGGRARDGKWGLLYEFARLAAAPDIIAMENVPNVARHAVFRDFVTTLQRLGYHVWHGVIDSSRHGVPQTRHRMVLLASRRGAIDWVAPDPGAPPTVRQTIGRMRPLKAGAVDAEDPVHAAAALSERNMRRIRSSTPGGTWRDWPDDLRVDCHRAASGQTYPGVYGRMEWDKPAPTITTQCYGFGNGRFGHPEQDRAISLREAALLQGFPQEYVFLPPGAPTNFKVLGRLIGNAVPVRLGRAIARSINDHIAGIGKQGQFPETRRPLRQKG